MWLCRLFGCSLEVPLCKGFTLAYHVHVLQPPLQHTARVCGGDGYVQLQPVATNVDFDRSANHAMGCNLR